MEKIKAALRRIADRLTGRRADLAKSRRRRKVWRERTGKLHKRQKAAEAKGRKRLAAIYRRRAERAHRHSRYWLERVRRDDSAIEALEALEAKLHDQEADWLKKHGVTFEGENRIRGGTYEQRAHAAQVRAMRNYQNGTRTLGPEYYSMEGGPRDYAHTLYHYPQGRINDCSTYADGTKYVTGDPSPSGPRGYQVGGWTGTELEHCKRVTGKVKCGDLVIYLGGSMGSHHVEVVLDPEAKTTTGHGDSAINIGCNGSWDLFDDGNYVIVRPPREHASA